MSVYHLWDESDRGKSKCSDRKLPYYRFVQQKSYTGRWSYFFILINARKFVFVMNFYIDLIHMQ